MTPQRIDTQPTHTDRLATYYELRDLGETHLLALDRAGPGERQWEKHLATESRRGLRERKEGERGALVQNR